MAASNLQQLGEFEIIEKIGAGAMGAVYRARQTSLGRIVALKLLPAHYANDPDFLARFRNEAAAAAALNHENIVQVYAAGVERGTHYFAMEFVEGESLGARLDRKGLIAPREAVAIAYHVARALDHAWSEAQIIHRDIKPDNIFLSREGTVKLGDLGLAKMLGGTGMELTQTGVAMGTPYYVSPEQAMGSKEVDFRSDIYSIGCTLYHILTGEPPYRGASAMAVMLQHVSQPPPQILKVWPECPAPFAGLLDKMLRKRPAERHQSYQELLQQLMWVQGRLDAHDSPDAANASLLDPGRRVAKPTTPPPGRGAASAGAPPKPPRRGGLWKAAAALACAAGIAAAMIWSPRKEKNQPTAPSGTTADHQPGTPVSIPNPQPQDPKASKLGKIVAARTPYKQPVSIPKVQPVQLPPPQTGISIPDRTMIPVSPTSPIPSHPHTFPTRPQQLDAAERPVAKWALDMRGDVWIWGMAAPISSDKIILGGAFEIRKLNLSDDGRAYKIPPLKGNDLARLNNLSGLEELVLRGHPIGDEGVRLLAKIPSLKSLSVHACGITDASMSELIKLPNLETLDVGFSMGKITDAGAAKLLSLPRLKWLNIYASSITDKTLTDVLAKMPNLQWVEVTATGVTPQGVADLEKAKPGCRVIRRALRYR